MTRSLPETIGGRYRVVRRLGQGGMGSVYEAIDEGGARVAVKVITTELASNKTLVGRFEREARAAAAIDTPHITRTLDTGTDPLTGLPFLVMELLDGEDLEQLLTDLGPLPPDVALRVAAQACIALHKAHEARVLHRDIKPANLFLARQPPAAPHQPGGRIVKLLDFGVAKVRPEVSRSNAETAGLTRTGSMLGSPLYMSPEQARGYKDIDFRSDLWSLGVVLYRMLSGRTPHQDTEELGELIILICTEPPAPIQDVAPWVPPEVAAIVHRALRFSPAERHSSAAELHAAIAALLRGGHALTDAMLLPMTDAERAVIAPRLAADLTDAPPPRKGGHTTGSGATSLPRVPAGTPVDDVTLAMPGRGPAPQAPALASGPAPAPVSTLSGGATSVAQTVSLSPAPHSTPAPSRSVLPWVLVAAIGILAGAGLGVARFMGLFGGASTDPASAASQAPPPDTRPRSVTVVVLPPSATVEVEGQATTLSDGILEINGPVGSVHKVKVVAGGIEKNVRVVVSESGAIPPKIEVEGAVPAATATAIVPGATAAPAPTARPKPRPSATATEPLRDKR